MGKPIGQSENEIDKSIKQLEYYQKVSDKYLKPEHLDSIFPAHQGEIIHQPLGPTLGKFLTLESIIFVCLLSLSDYAMELSILAPVQNNYSTHGCWQLYHA